MVVSSKYIVTFKSNNIFMKPHMAMRCSTIYSQDFILPSTLNGLKEKHELQALSRCKLHFSGYHSRQSTTTVRNPDITNKNGIIVRKLLIDPIVYLAFDDEEEAIIMSETSICIGDLDYSLTPEEEILVMTDEEFSLLEGTEFVEDENGDCLGFDIKTLKEINGFIIRNYS